MSRSATILCARACSLLAKCRTTMDGQDVWTAVSRTHTATGSLIASHEDRVSKVGRLKCGPPRPVRPLAGL